MSVAFVVGEDLAGGDLGFTPSGVDVFHLDGEVGNNFLHVGFEGVEGLGVEEG